MSFRPKPLLKIYEGVAYCSILVKIREGKIETTGWKYFYTKTLLESGANQNLNDKCAQKKKKVPTLPDADETSDSDTENSDSGSSSDSDLTSDSSESQDSDVTSSENSESDSLSNSDSTE